MRFRKDFYSKHPDEKDGIASPEAQGEPVESYIYSPDESLNLSLEYYSPKAVDDVEDEKEAVLKHLPRRYLRCPAAVTVFHLQKLIRAKYGLSEAHRVDIMYKEEPLCASYTLMDIMYIYHWRRVS
jgi:polycomb group RING finger protein 4